MQKTPIALLTAAILAACTPADTPQPALEDAPPASLPGTAATHDEFLGRLRSLCGQAFEGELAIGAPTDTAFQGRRAVIHVRECTEDEVRIPLHVGENRSRTWIVTRTDSGLRLKHDHRHEDGSEDTVTQYGGDTRDDGTAGRQDFHADAFTAELLPPARTNVWTMEVEPGAYFAYALRRTDSDRHFRLEFDLTRPVEAPPAPWGQD